MTMLQKARNRMLNTITGTWQRDRVRIKDLLEMTNNMSVNQTAAQIKLCEMRKASKVEDYPVKMEKIKYNIGERLTRQNKEEKFKETARTKLGMSTFVTDGARLWNRAPKNVTSAKTIWQAKKTIKEYCKKLPI
jgi:chromatin remodeling complex protein RSC6